MKKTKIAIGCLVQWFEAEIIGEYIESLKDALSQYDGEVIVDFHITSNEDLEKPSSPEKMKYCLDKIKKEIIGNNFKYKFDSTLVTIADYRRNFNEKYCEQVEVLMWGESDAILPKQTFTVIDLLHQQTSKENPKYLAFFGTCKMWDKSWEPIEHSDFTVKPFIENDYDNWWSLKYTMNKEEIDKINEKATELDVQTVSPHKFNGCGLVISSEVIKAGVNIPKSVFFVHEDTAFMLMTNKVLGNIPQYVIKNILLVHNRKHPDKRMFVDGEIGDTMQRRRESNTWYTKAHQMCEQNCYNIFNPKYTPYTWNNVFTEK